MERKGDEKGTKKTGREGHRVDREERERKWVRRQPTACHRNREL